MLKRAVGLSIIFIGLVAGSFGLESPPGEGRTAIMCAEALYFRCHRRLISDFLVANGIAVLHISTEHKVIPHELPSYASVENGVVTYPGEEVKE